mgnify:FL=1
MSRLAFFFDSSACSGCKTCQMACKDKNDLPVGQVWRRVYEVTGGGWKQEGHSWIQDVVAYNLSIACNHCEDPVCAKICPTTAIRKREDGIVLIDQSACIGCKYCAWACPYGAPQFNPDKGVMGKCDLCADYLDQGKNPSCVDACPMRALDFGQYDELLRRYGDSSHLYPLPDPSITQPSILVRPHQGAGGTEAMVSNVEEVKSA